MSQEQVSLSFTILPSATETCNFSVFPVDENGGMIASEMKSVLINSPSGDPAEEALLKTIRSAIATFRQAKGI